MVMKALNIWTRKRHVRIYTIWWKGKSNTRKLWKRKRKNGKIGMRIILKGCEGRRMHKNLWFKDDDPSMEQRAGLDPLRAREKFKRQKGEGVGEWGVGRKMTYLDLKEDGRKS
jgi:hypothetical protein